MLPLNGLSFSCKSIVKKETFKSVTIIGHSLCNREVKELPGCREPISWITLFMILKSVNILHFLNFLFITSTGEFQVLEDSLICWPFSCSYTSFLRPVISLMSGLSVNHLKGRAVGTFERWVAVVPCSCTTQIVDDCPL